jgi:pectinesterase
MYADGDRLCFEDCAFIGSQDTLFMAPLPEKEAQPRGFAGPGESLPRIMGRQFYINCYLQGDVDFIFGGAIALFDNCEIYSKMPGDRIPGESPESETILGYATAASTPKGWPYGYVFRECQFVSDCPPGTVYLGRPWREYTKTVLLHCSLGAHIHPKGWQDWGKTHGHFLYAEYESTGPGASPDTRADFSIQLTDEEAAAYTTERILEGWKPPCTQIGII